MYVLFVESYIDVGRRFARSAGLLHPSGMLSLIQIYKCQINNWGMFNNVGLYHCIVQVGV